jgi:hypothetical protein
MSQLGGSMFKVLLSITVLTALLTACSFIVTVDGTAHNVSVRPVVPTASLPYPTPTSENTAVPTTEVPRFCEARIGAYRQNVRADHLETATIIGNIGAGDWLRVDKLFIYADVINEWAHGTATDVNTGKAITGWIKLGENAVLADSKECWEIEREYPVPTPTPQPTATPGVPEECLLKATVNVNVRTSPTGSVFRVLAAGATIAAEARYQGTGYLWYKVWVPEDLRYGWTADFYTELTTKCEELPFISPF